MAMSLIERSPHAEGLGASEFLQSQKVLLLVVELGLAHDARPCRGQLGLLDEPALRALNPTAACSSSRMTVSRSASRAPPSLPRGALRPGRFLGARSCRQSVHRRLD